jgi:DNA-binding HxlR family transcriptional regulator
MQAPIPAPRQDAGITPASEPEVEPTPLEAALARVGDRWSLLVIDALLDGPRRFNELQNAISGIATNVLAQRLRHLAAEGVVVARPYSTRPVRYAYELTRGGHDLAGALRLLAHWATAHGAADAPTHDACGTPIDARWYCPTCDDVVDDQNASTLRYV